MYRGGDGLEATEESDVVVDAGKEDEGEKREEKKGRKKEQE